MPYYSIRQKPMVTLAKTGSMDTEECLLMGHRNCESHAEYKGQEGVIAETESHINKQLPGRVCRSISQ
jgi:hypothetical protein